MTTIVIILALTVAWYVIWFSVPHSKRGIANAICAILFGCIMIAITLNQLNS
jgi:hypothetical protein